MEVREVHLVRHPNGMPVESDFALVRRALPPPSNGQVLVQNLLVSIDPYTRLRLKAPDAVGKPVFSSGLGRIVQSCHPAFRSGDLVRHRHGYCEGFVGCTDGLMPFKPRPGLPLSAQLYALGGIGFCAYGGLLGIGRMKAGEQVFVSSAAGAVGSLAVQIAKLKGCTVIGSTGSATKAAWLRDTLKLDAVVNYKTSDLMTALAAATPNGIDVYFDNVGGAHLQAALARMNRGGRIPVCGMIAGYNGADTAVRFDETLILKGIEIRGFGFADYPHLQADFETEVAAWLRDGSLILQESFFEGIENAPSALIALLDGSKTGKISVRLPGFDRALT